MLLVGGPVPGGRLPLTFEPGLSVDFITYNVTGHEVPVQYARVPLHLRCDWALAADDSLLRGRSGHFGGPRRRETRPFRQG